MTYKIGEPVKYDAGAGSWGIILYVYEDGNTYDVKWYYGIDVKGEYMTAISHRVNGHNIIAVNENDFWKRVNRKGFNGEPVESGKLWVKNETINWFEGNPNTDGLHLVKKKGFHTSSLLWWDNTNKEFSSIDHELITFFETDVIYHAAAPIGP